MKGRTLAHYKVGERLGRGGMGEVYLAEDTRLGRRVALKVLPPDLAIDPERRERFEREARTIAALNHPNIVTVHSVEQADTSTGPVHFITMELVEGDILSALIPRDGLPLDRFLELAIPLADAVGSAHRKGITHRDLKPANVMVDGSSRVKVLDFGLAKLRGASGTDDAALLPTATVTAEGKILGTVAYMAPEQAEGKPVDSYSDVFSLGIILYEMATGRRPFRGDTSLSTLSAILKDTPPPVTDVNPRIPPDLARIIKRCLAKNPQDRFQSAAGLRSELAALREELDPTAAVRSIARGSRRPGWLLPLVLLAALGILAVVFGPRLLRPAEPGAAEATAAAGIGASGRPAIAVLSFEDHTGSEEIRWLSTGLPVMLLTGLAQTPGLDVVSSQRIREILRQVGQEDLAAIDQAVITEVARRAGAGAVVVGSIFRSGEELRIDVQIEDVGTGRLLSAQTVSGRDVFPMVDELTGLIRSSMQIVEPGSRRGIAEVSTTSIEAFRHYSEGLEAAANLRRIDARDSLLEAVRLDPAFALAHFELYRTFWIFGDQKRADQHMQEVLARLDKLPERLRLFVLATNARHEGDSLKAADLLERLLSRYPDDTEAYRTLAWVYDRELNRTDDSVEVLKRAVDAFPQSGPAHNDYAYGLLRVERFREAIRELERYTKLSPGEPNPYDSLGEVYLVTGRPLRAAEQFERAIEIDPTFVPAYEGLIWSHAMDGRYDAALSEAKKIDEIVAREGLPSTIVDFLSGWLYSRVGRYEEAEARISRGIKVANSVDDAIGEAAMRLLASLLSMERGRYDEALARANEALAIAPGIGLSPARQGTTFVGDVLCGVAEVRTGRLDASRRRLLGAQARLDEAETPFQARWFPQVLETEIALAVGDLDGASAALSVGEPRSKPRFTRSAIYPAMFSNNVSLRDVGARLASARGDLDEAIAIYEQLTTPDISSTWTSWLEPRYVLALGRLHARSGDAEAARREYARFLELWKDADPGQPELAEARDFLAGG